MGVVGTYCWACRPYFSADFHQTKTILKRLTSTLRWEEWKVAHGPTTWPPLWLSEAVFITDRAQLEFLVSTYCRACRPYFLADFNQTQTILKRVSSTLRWVEWKVAHGPTTWPPLWLSEAVFIADRAKLEFLVSTYCRACRPYFLADFHQTQTILKRVTSTLRWVEWKVAHGPTTWPPLWLSEAVFITDRAYNAGAKLEFLVSTYCRACRPYFLADFHQTQTILKRVTSTLRWVEWKEAHGPTTWPPLWLSEAAFITAQHIMLVQSWNSAHMQAII